MVKKNSNFFYIRRKHTPKGGANPVLDSSQQTESFDQITGMGVLR